MAPTTLRLLAFLLLAAGVHPAGAQPYTILDIVPPPGFEEVYPVAINNRLQVIGSIRHTVFPDPWRGTVDQFLWDPVNGIRRLGLGLDIGVAAIDDAGVIYGIRHSGRMATAFKWVNGIMYDLPTPPHDDGVAIAKVTSNGIVEMHATLAGATRTWALRGGDLIDLDALSGAQIEAVNEQMAIAGCQYRLSSDPDRVPQVEPHPYVRFADGRVIQPSGSPSCVRVLGPSGHFAGVRILQRYVGLRLVTEYFWYYGTPDGRVITLPSPLDAGMVAINRSGLLVGHTGNAPFVAHAGMILDLREAIVTSSRALGSFLPRAVTDAGAILGVGGSSSTFNGSGAVLVATAPGAPTRLTFSVSGRNVTLNWDQSVGAVEYFVEAGSAPGAANVYVGSVGALTLLRTAAPPGRYYVRVRARNAQGFSASSNEVLIDVR